MLIHIIYDETKKNLVGYRSKTSATEATKSQKDITIVDTYITAMTKEEYTLHVLHESTRLDRFGKPVTYLEIL